MSDLLRRVDALADALFADTLEVDRTGMIPPSHWQRLADEGMYGLFAPPEHGGPGLLFPELVQVLERMGGSCLPTTFTWLQHHSAVIALATTANTALREELLRDAVSGHRRFGAATAGVVPDVPRMRAERIADGWRFSGPAPFVSGWGLVHMLLVSARDVDSDDVISGIIPAREQPGVTNVEPLTLIAADASRTVSLTIDELIVPDDRVVSRVPRATFQDGQAPVVRLVGTLPIGIALRCALLIEQAGHPDTATSLRARCAAVRDRLDAGLDDMSALLRARADGAELAVHAASALVVAGGGPSLLRGGHASLLAREAMFTMVAGTRPGLKEELLRLFTQQ